MVILLCLAPLGGAVAQSPDERPSRERSLRERAPSDVSGVAVAVVDPGATAPRGSAWSNMTDYERGKVVGRGLFYVLLAGGLLWLLRRRLRK